MASRRVHLKQRDSPEEGSLVGRYNRAPRVIRGAQRLQAPIPEHEHEALLQEPPLGSAVPRTVSTSAVGQVPRPALLRSSSQPYNRYASDNDALDEMESMFRAPDSERTDFKSLVSDEPEVKAPKRYSEHDYQAHFREDQFARPHEPLKPVTTKKKRKKSDDGGHPRKDSDGARPARKLSVQEEEGDEEEEEQAEGEGQEEPEKGADLPPPYSSLPPSAPGEAATPPQSPTDEESMSMVPKLTVSDEAPVLDQRGAYVPDVDASDSKDSRVKFHVGHDGHDDGEEDDAAESKDTVGASGAPSSKESRKHRRHHRHVEDPAVRRVPGSERRPRRTSTGQGPLDDDLGADGTDQYIDDISSHRFEEAGHRRHKVKKKEDRVISNVVHLGDINTGQAMLLGKKTFDHTPHDMFVEMDELTAIENELEWQETARWIKYEEDVEQGANRWGKPHLASLSFQSLMNLRRCLEKGVVLLDVEEHDSVAISHRIAMQLQNEDHIQQQDFGSVMRTLLLRRQHVQDPSAKGIRGYMSSRNLSKLTLQSLADLRNNSARSLSEIDKDKEKKGSVSGVSSSHLQIPRQNSIGGESNASAEDLRRFFAHHNILRRMAPGTEAFSVNVGRVDFVKKPVAAFVRLAEGTFLPGITEMPLPVRFIFFLIGPQDADEDYHETGRAFATLMSSPSFHEMAYKAESRNDLMWAFKDFLDDTLVLPPIDWTNPDVLDVHALQAKSREIQEKKRERQERQRLMSLASDGADGGGGGGPGQNGAPPPPGGDGRKPSQLKKLELADVIVDDPLARVGRPFAGLIRDIKRRYPFYLSDFKDGINSAVFSCAFFIFFAALAGAITFGGLMMDKTDLQIGISETLISTSVVGIIFALFSCQPLIIIGTTGPVLLFDEALFQFTQSNGLEFLTMRVWIAIWMFLISLIVVALEGSVFVKKFTRFTTEIFSSLVSILFVFESLSKLATVFAHHPLLANYCDDPLFLRSLHLIMDGVASVFSEDNSTTTTVAPELASSTADGNATLNTGNGTDLLNSDAPLTDPRNQPNTALLSLLLMFGTFGIANYLRHFRNSKFLGRRVRRMLGDFGVPIAILLMVGLDQLVPQVYTQTLKVPTGLTPSDPEVRGWFISPLGVNEPLHWVSVVGAIPAAGLIFIVIYMETMVCQLIMAKPERNLAKGTGFHFDIVLISLLNLMVSLVGAPWMCAATIRSVSHAAALTVVSSTYAPGEKPRVIGVHEQRLSALLVSILLGLSVVLSSVLGNIPVAVVFGIFMYMGVSSMAGVQFLERCVLFLKPVKHHPDEVYVKRVRTWRMHMYTVIQLICLGFLLGIKFTPAAIGFPFFLALLIPLRLFVLPRIFSQQEIIALDGEGEQLEDEDADFFEEAHQMPSAASTANFMHNSSLGLLRIQSNPSLKV